LKGADDPAHSVDWHFSARSFWLTVVTAPFMSQRRPCRFILDPAGLNPAKPSLDKEKPGK
jgi:hypothetical protein